MGRLDVNGIGIEYSRNEVYDSTVLAWVAMTQPGSVSGGGSTQVLISKFLDSSNAAWAVADSANNALRVNVVAGAAGGSTAVTLSRIQDSSNNGIAVADSVNNAIRVNVVAGAAGGSTIITISTGSVSINGNSTVFQGTSPWVISGNSTAFQGGAWAVRANLSSTATDNPISITAGNSSVTITAVAAGAGRLNIGSTAADNAVSISGNSTAFQGGAWTVRSNISSTAADNPVLISGNSTVVQGTSPWIVSQSMNSSVAPSSASSGMICRIVVDNILTTASTNALVSSALTIQSSAAGLRSYVVAYSILSTNAGPNKLKFYSGSTMLWPVIFAAVSSAVSGANLAVGAPAYLFRTKVAGPLSLNLASSLAGFQAAVSYFRAP